MMYANNVVKLDTENIKVYDQICRYFEKLERRSITTRNTYEGEIRSYFKLMKGRELEHLSIDDVQLTLDDFEDYIKYLSKLKIKSGSNRGQKVYQNSTINKKITSLKEIIKYLASKKIVEDISYFPLIETQKNNSEPWDAMTPDEVIHMANLALNEKEKPYEKYLLFLFAGDTAIRKSALLEVKWSNFKENNIDIEIIGIDKGNKLFTKRISKNFYQKLLTIKGKSPFVFSLTVPTIDAMFRRLKAKMDFGNRRIVFHSIRHCGGNFIYSQTKDLEATREWMGHSSSVTTQRYTHADNKYGAIGMISIKDSIDTELYKKVSLEELINAIEGLDSGYQILINKKIQENLGNNK